MRNLKAIGLAAALLFATCVNAQWPGWTSRSPYDPANVAITGGTIDSAVIGGTTPAAITGTTITATTKFLATSGTITTSAPAYNGTQTWNSGGVSFTGIGLTITDTASANASPVISILGGAGGATNWFSVFPKGFGAGGSTVISGSGGVGLSANATGADATLRVGSLGNAYLYTSGGAIATHWDGVNAASRFKFESKSTITWSATQNDPDTSVDTGISRSSAGLIVVGNGTQGNASGQVNASVFNPSTSLQINGKLLFRVTAPTISSGFGTSPSIVASNGTAAFTVDVGTGGTATNGVIAMPVATTGWLCTVNPAGAPQAAAINYSAPTSTSSITITNYTLTTGLALAWTASTVLQVKCVGY